MIESESPSQRKKDFHKGQKVKIVVGPFKGRIGQIVRVEKSQNEWSTWITVGWPDGSTSMQFPSQMELV